MQSECAKIFTTKYLTTLDRIFYSDEKKKSFQSTTHRKENQPRYMKINNLYAQMLCE